MNRMIGTFLGTFLAASLLLSAGCASVQKPIPLSFDALREKPARIGVAMTRIPNPDTQFPGASCLLCIAAANVTNASLTSYANSLKPDDLATLPRQIVEGLRAKGIDARVVEERIDPKVLPSFSASSGEGPAKDFRRFAARLDVDKLLVIEVAVLGFERTYSSYVPTSDPKGFVVGAGYLVDLQSNTYDWYAPVRVVKGVDGKWDEPPTYPGLTNAFFQALETSRDQWLGPFIAR